MKKFAVCFSGYPRFVKHCFNNIKEDLLDGLGEYDIYANFQWNEDWQNTEIWIEYEKRFAERNVRVTYFPYTTHTSSSMIRSLISKKLI